MQSNNFALRMPHSILEALRLAAASDGVAMNQYVNVAVAEKLASRQTAAAFLKARAAKGSPSPIPHQCIRRPVSRVAVLRHGHHFEHGLRHARCPLSPDQGKLATLSLSTGKSDWTVRHTIA